MSSNVHFRSRKIWSARCSTLADRDVLQRSREPLLFRKGYLDGTTWLVAVSRGGDLSSLLLTVKPPNETKGSATPARLCGIPLNKH